MIEVQKVFTVSKPVEAVQAYLRDFANAAEWDPGTKSCRPDGSDPIAVGKTWHNVSVFRGKETELTYRLTALSPGHLQFVGENKTVTSTDDISLTSAGDGTTITYSGKLNFHGLAKLATPFLKGEFGKLADKTEEQMTRVINNKVF